MCHSQSLRDLCWAVNSPSLLGSAPATVPVDAQHLDARSLASFLNGQPQHRVGRYFERLVLYWLQSIRQLEIVAESLQIRDGKRTVGEIDLLFRDEQRRLTHWEIAVKFYLYHPHCCSLGSHFIGPNARDTFERKMERLFAHQLPRSAVLFPDVQVRQAFVKGRIFYHPDHALPFTRPPHLAPDHLHSVWIRCSQLDWFPRSADVAYRILRKPYWLSEERAARSDSDLLSGGELTDKLVDHFSHDERGVLISRLTSEPGTNEALSEWSETERVFVVSDSWPLPAATVRQGRTP